MKLLVASITETVKTGYRFSRSSWPLHITFVPWFNIEQYDELHKELAKTLSRRHAFQVTVGPKEMFGVKNDVHVNTVSASVQIKSLHEELLTVVSKYAQIENGRFAGKSYRPHITHQQGRGYEPGNIVTVESVSVIKLISPGEAKVIDRHELQK